MAFRAPQSRPPACSHPHCPLDATQQSTHLGASHQAKTHGKATAGQDGSPGPKPASAMASGPGIIQNLLPKGRARSAPVQHVGPHRASYGAAPIPESQLRAMGHSSRRGRCRQSLLQSPVPAGRRRPARQSRACSDANAELQRQHVLGDIMGPSETEQSQP